MTNNPTVNRYLKDKAMDHIDHALGRPVYPLRETYRNYFATHASGKIAADFSASSHWEKTGQRGDMAYFVVTQSGREALKNHLDDKKVHLGKPWRCWCVEFGGYCELIPATSRGQAKYLRWLGISDCCPDLSFGAFVKSATIWVAS